MPKTKSGKILRRSLKEIIEGKTIDQLGDFTKELKDVSKKLIQLLKLEEKINTIYQGE